MLCRHHCSGWRSGDHRQCWDFSTRPSSAVLLTNADCFLILPAASAPAGVGDCRRTITTVRTETDEDKIVSTTWQSIDGLRSHQESIGVAGAATSTRTRPMLGAVTGTQVYPDGTGVVTTTEIVANGNTVGVATRKDANGTNCI